MAPRNVLDVPATYDELKRTRSKADLYQLENAFENEYLANLRIRFPSFRSWLQDIDRQPNTTNLDAKVMAFIEQKKMHFRSIIMLFDENIFPDTCMSGTAMMSEILRAGKRNLYIDPMNWDEVTARVFADVTKLPDGTVKEELVRDGRGNPIPYPLSGPKRAEVHGNALGVESGVRFSPHFYSVRNIAKSLNTKTAPPWEAPDVVLFHEMVHATAYLHGAGSSRPVGADFDTESEFIAITLANIYISEYGGTVLRANHRHGLDILQNPATFLDNYPTMQPSPREILKRFSLHQMKYYFNIAWIPSIRAEFNPLRQMFWENSGPPGTYQKLAAGAPKRW